MGNYNKISSAFKPFFAKSGPNDKRDAIVIHKVPKVQVPSRLRTLTPNQRSDYVNDRSAVQKPIQEKLLEGYQNAASKHLSGKQPLAVSTIGTGTLPVVTAEVTRKTLSDLAEQPNVVAILPNQKIKFIQPKQVNYYSELTRQETKDRMTWGLKQLNIRELWNNIPKGEGINVAVLDTGVDGEHPALSGRVKDFIMIDPLRRRITAEPIFDSGQHGTHVCGTIAGGMTSDGVAIGVAPKANLLVAGIFEGNMTLLTLMEGISWAVEKGVDIINISIGFSYYEPFFDKVFEDLVLYHDVLPVVAIGNEYHGNSSSPGNMRNALAVGAMEEMPEGRIEVASFSSGASLVIPSEGLDNPVTKPDVVAPGVQIYSCVPSEHRSDETYEHTYSYMDGTSMATPHVAGVAALLMSARPQAAAFEIFAALKETAKHPRGKKRRPDTRWGFGMICPVEALKALKAK